MRVVLHFLVLGAIALVLFVTIDAGLQVSDAANTTRSAPQQASWFMTSFVPQDKESWIGVLAPIGLFFAVLAAKGKRT